MTEWEITNAESGSVYRASSISLSIGTDDGPSNCSCRIPDFTSNIDQISDDFQIISGKYYSISAMNKTISFRADNLSSFQVGKNSGITISGRVFYVGSFGSWSGITAFDAGAIIVASGSIFLSESGGTSGANEPTWPSGVGSSIVDNEITWRNSGVFYQPTTTEFTPIEIVDVLSYQISTSSHIIEKLVDEKAPEIWVNEYIEYSNDVLIVKSISYNITPSKMTQKIIARSV